MRSNWISHRLWVAWNATAMCSFSSAKLRRRTAAKRFIRASHAFARTTKVGHHHSESDGHRIWRRVSIARHQAIFHSISMSCVRIHCSLSYWYCTLTFCGMEFSFNWFVCFDSGKQREQLQLWRACIRNIWMPNRKWSTTIAHRKTRPSQNLCLPQSFMLYSPLRKMPYLDRRYAHSEWTT